MSRTWVSVELIGMVALMAAISLAPIGNRAEEVSALSAAPSPSEGSRRGDLTPDTNTIIHIKVQVDPVFAAQSGSVPMNMLQLADGIEYASTEPVVELVIDILRLGVSTGGSDEDRPTY